MKKLLLILSLIFLILTGCSSKSERSTDTYGTNDYSVLSTESFSKTDAYNGLSFNGVAATNSLAEESFDGDALLMEDVATENANNIKKVIVTAYAKFETLKFDESINKLESLVKQYNGYVQNSSLEKYGSGKRYADLIVRVPADSFDKFIKDAKDGENVVSYSTNVNDITDDYYDVQSKIKSLKAEEEVVLSFYEKAETIEDLIAVENRLSDLRYELGNYEAKMKNYELLTSYSTITFRIEEVQVLTPVEDNFAEKVRKECIRSWENFKMFCEDLLFWLINNVWGLIILVIFIIGGRKVVQRIRRNKKKLKPVKNNVTIIQEENKNKTPE